MPRHLVPRLVAGLVAVVGLVVLVVAALLAASGSGRETVVGRGPGAGPAPVLTTAPGMLELIRGGVRIQAGAGAAGPVFVGIGRAGDVQAYLGQVSRIELTGLSADRRLTSRKQGSEPSLPDPAEADIWAVSARGKGPVQLAWPQQPGRWQLLVAADGSTTAPAQVSLSWTRDRSVGGLPALVGTGLLLLVGGLGALLVLWLRPGGSELVAGRSGRRSRTGSAAPYPYQDDVPDPDLFTPVGPQAAPPDADPAPPQPVPPALPTRVPLPSSMLAGAEGVIDRRMATPGLAPDHPTTQLRRVQVPEPPAAEPGPPDPGPPDPDQLDPDQPGPDQPEHPTALLRRVRVDRPWASGERPGRES